MRKLPLQVFIAFAGLLPGLAQAELSCPTFIRGIVLEDPDVIAQAAAISAPLLATGWMSMAMKDEAVTTVAGANFGRNLLLHQIERDCRALPDESVDSVVATHTRVAVNEHAELQAEEEKRKAADAAQQKQWADEEAARMAEVARWKAAADRVAPKMSCRWQLEFMRQSGGRPTEDDHANMTGRDEWDWCSAHLKASAAQFEAVARRNNWE
jgi:hypothetical protein